MVSVCVCVNTFFAHSVDRMRRVSPSQPLNSSASLRSSCSASQLLLCIAACCLIDVGGISVRRSSLLSVARTPASSRPLADSACYQFGHLGTRLDCEKLSPISWRGSTFRTTMTMPDGSRACTGSAKGCGLGCGSCDVEASAVSVTRLKLGQMHAHRPRCTEACL